MADAQVRESSADTVTVGEFLAEQRTIYVPTTKDGKVVEAWLPVSVRGQSTARMQCGLGLVMKNRARRLDRVTYRVECSMSSPGRAFLALALFAGCSSPSQPQNQGILLLLDRPPAEAHVRAAQTVGAEVVLPVVAVNGVYEWGPASGESLRGAVPNVVGVMSLGKARLPEVEVLVTVEGTPMQDDATWMRSLGATSAFAGDSLVSGTCSIDLVDRLRANARFQSFRVRPTVAFAN